MPKRIPTPGIPTPAVRKSPSAQPSVTQQRQVGSTYSSTGKKTGTVSGTATSKKPTPASNINKAEAALSSAIKSGKVTDINKTREEIAKKTGVWPNGKTN